MKYRVLRKNYAKCFGHTMFIAAVDKPHKAVLEVSNIVTAHLLRKCLNTNCDGTELIVGVLQNRCQLDIKLSLKAI